MDNSKAINRKKLVAFVLSIIAKGVDLMPNKSVNGKPHTWSKKSAALADGDC